MSKWPDVAGLKLPPCWDIYLYFYSPALKKWSYIGFGLSVILYVHNSVILSVIIPFPLRKSGAILE